MTDNRLFNEDEWNAMVSTSHEIISAQVPDHLGILHHGLCQNLDFTGTFQMPVVKPILCDIPKRIVAFYRTTTGKYGNAVPHFYTDDKHLEGLWTYPNKFVDSILSRDSLIIGQTSLSMRKWSLPRSYGIYLRTNCLWLGGNSMELMSSPIFLG